MSREEEIRVAVQRYRKATDEYQALLIGQLTRKNTAFRGIDEYLIKEEQMAGIVSADGKSVMVGQHAWLLDTRDWHWRILIGVLRNEYSSASAVFWVKEGRMGENYTALNADIFSSAENARIELLNRIETNLLYLDGRRQQLLIIRDGLKSWNELSAGFNVMVEPEVADAWKGNEMWKGDPLA